MQTKQAELEPGPATIRFEPKEADRMPLAVVDFVRRIIEASEEFERHDLRQSRRFEIGAPMLVIPLDQNHKPIGNCFEAYGRNVSAGGAGIVHTRSLRAEYVAVQISTRAGQMLKMIAKVIRCKPLGRFYDIGLQFIAKLP